MQDNRKCHALPLSPKHPIPTDPYPKYGCQLCLWNEFPNRFWISHLPSLHHSPPEAQYSTTPSHTWSILFLLQWPPDSSLSLDWHLPTVLLHRWLWFSFNPGSSSCWSESGSLSLSRWPLHWVAKDNACSQYSIDNHIFIFTKFLIHNALIN